MFAVVLVAPEIATNTGNIIRLCANAGARLLVVEPLGFTMDDTSLKRAGLDYHDLADVTVHPDTAAAVAAVAGRRRFTFSSRATHRFDEVAFEPARPLTIPMRPGNRSLNLANAVAIVVYEAWRQIGFVGAAGLGATTSETLTDGPADR